MKPISFPLKLSVRDGNSFKNWMNCRSGSLLLILISMMNTHLTQETNQMILWLDTAEFWIRESCLYGTMFVGKTDILFRTIFSQKQKSTINEVKAELNGAAILFQGAISLTADFQADIRMTVKSIRPRGAQSRERWNEKSGLFYCPLPSTLYLLIVFHKTYLGDHALEK